MMEDKLPDLEEVARGIANRCDLPFLQAWGANFPSHLKTYGIEPDDVQGYRALFFLVLMNRAPLCPGRAS